MFVKTVTRYETTDGTIFDDKEDANQYEAEYLLRELLVKDFSYRTELQYWHNAASLAAILRANPTLVERVMQIDWTD